MEDSIEYYEFEGTLYKIITERGIKKAFGLKEDGTFSLTSVRYIELNGNPLLKAEAYKYIEQQG